MWEQAEQQLKKREKISLYNVVGTKHCLDHMESNKIETFYRPEI